MIEVKDGNIVHSREEIRDALTNLARVMVLLHLRPNENIYARVQQRIKELDDMSYEIIDMWHQLNVDDEEDGTILTDEDREAILNATANFDDGIRHELFEDTETSGM